MPQGMFFMILTAERGLCKYMRLRAEGLSCPSDDIVAEKGIDSRVRWLQTYIAHPSDAASAFDGRWHAHRFRWFRRKKEMAFSGAGEAFF